jgi:acetyltransferase
MAADTRLQVIAIHGEGITRGRSFIEAATRASTRIPVVALKTGRTLEGARAAATHSGSMAGEDAIVDAAMRKAGVIRVSETSEIRDLVRGFVRLPAMRGTRVGVVTLTGAGGIIVLDAMAIWNLKAAGLSGGALQRVQELSPPWMGLSNPVDIWPALMKHGMKRVYRITLGDVLSDRGVHGVICVALGLPPDEQAHLGVVEVIQEMSEKTAKPMVVWFYGSRAADAAALVEQEGRALAVTSLEQGVRVLARMAQYERWKTTAAMS